MRKLFIKVLTGALLLCLLLTGLVACGSADNWTKPTLTNPGNVVSDTNGGFLVETANYLYFINGMATSTEDNTFGAPVKGSLMVQDKNDFSKAPQIVVPKLFASTDYQAGVYIYNGRAYYGSPSTEKNSSGEIANNEMTFASTKLDGTDTKTYFTVDSLSVNFRILNNNGKVYIVYYDTAEQALYSYDVDAGENKEIIKTDATAEGENAVSLAEFKFLDNSAVSDGYAVVYTVTIYDEDYYESAASEDGYTRATKNYNVVYAYGIFDGAVKTEKILDGEQDELTYALKHVNETDVYATSTDLMTNEKNIVYDIEDGQTKQVVNMDVISSDSLILEDGNVITLSGGKFTLRDALNNDNATQKVIAIDDNATKILRFDEDSKYIYYLNEANTLCRMQIENEVAVRVEVSEDMVSSAWYAPEFIEIGGGEYAFYLDSSTKGGSYVKYVNLDKKYGEKLDEDHMGKDTNDDGEDDKFYLDGHAFLAQRTDKDIALYVTSFINDVSGDINSDGSFKFVEESNVLSVPSLTKANSIYDEYEEVQDLIDQSAIELLEKYNKAVEMANEYNKLKKAKELNKLSAEEKSALRTAYNSVKAEIEEFKNEENYVAVRNLLGADLNKYYVDCVAEFETAEN